MDRETAVKKIKEMQMKASRLKGEELELRKQNRSGVQRSKIRQFLEDHGLTDVVAPFIVEAKEVDGRLWMEYRTIPFYVYYKSSFKALVFRSIAGEVVLTYPLEGLTSIFEKIDDYIERAANMKRIVGNKVVEARTMTVLMEQGQLTELASVLHRIERWLEDATKNKFPDYVLGKRWYGDAREQLKALWAVHKEAADAFQDRINAIWKREQQDIHLEQRLEDVDRLHEDAIRARMARAFFYPFWMFEIKFSYAAGDEEEAAGAFWSLWDSPVADGYYRALDGTMRKPFYVYEVVEHRINRFEDVPWDCRREWRGQVLHTTPLLAKQFNVLPAISCLHASVTMEGKIKMVTPMNKLVAWKGKREGRMIAALDDPEVLAWSLVETRGNYDDPDIVQMRAEQDGFVSPVTPGEFLWYCARVRDHSQICRTMYDSLQSLVEPTELLDTWLDS